VEAAPLTSSQVVAFVVLDIAIILVVARVVGSLFRRIGQPRVVGEIVAGILLGPTLLGPELWSGFTAPTWLSCEAGLAASLAGALPSPTECLFPFQARSVLGVIGQLGLLLYMLLVGLEFDRRLVAGKWKGVLVVAIGVVAVPIAIGFLVAPMMTGAPLQPDGASDVGFSLFIGAMLSVTAFPVLARILQEKGVTTTMMGSIAVAAAAIVTVLMFVTMVAANSIAAGGETSALVRRFLWMAVYLVVMLAVVPRLMRAVTARIPADDAGGSFVAVLLLTLASGYVAHQLGLTVIVGGFLAGIALAEQEGVFEATALRLGDLVGIVLLPIFLAFSGLTTDFTQLSTDALAGIGIFLIAGVASKWGGGLVLGRAGGLTWREGNLVGVLMNCRGLLPLVVALVGVQAGVITPVMQLGAVLMALITTAMTGPLYDLFQNEPIRATPDPRGGMVGALGKDYYRKVIHSALPELAEEEADAVAGDLVVAHVEPGEVIVREGDPADRFYIIVEGELDVTQMIDDERRLLNRLGAGQFFGEIALLERSPRTATVTARTEATLLSMDEVQFRDLMARSLATARGFEAVVEARLRSL
jgi:Kef-type K+ transport system membrane component KefB